MPTVPLTAALRQEYQDLFSGCVIRPNRVAAVEALVDQLQANRARYEAVGTALSIP